MGLPEKLPEPMEVEAHFVGGPFDGKITTLTVKVKLNPQVSIVMRDKSVYRYESDFVFRFDGYQPQPEPLPKPTLKQRIQSRIQKWIFS